MFDASNSSRSSRSAFRISPLQLPTRDWLIHSQEKYLVILSCQTAEFLLGLLEKSDVMRALLQTVLWARGVFLQIVVQKVCSHLPRSLGHFVNSDSIPWNLTTTSHPILTVAILLKHLPLLVERPFQRCHLSRIDGVLKCGDSMTKPHMVSQIPSNSLYIQLSVCDGSKNFWRLTWRFWFYTVKSGSIDQQGLVPGQRAGECL